jgi:hypothetical protein
MKVKRRTHMTISSPKHSPTHSSVDGLGLGCIVREMPRVAHLGKDCVRILRNRETDRA